MKYFIIAGEASGDLHASHLMRALKTEDSQADFHFFGGDLMQSEGGCLEKHYREMAYMGFVNVAMNLHKVLRNMRECRQALVAYQPDVVILVDYPGFNLKIAGYAKRHLSCPVYYYIAPKLWAWKSYRIKTIKRYVDRMFTIFPFETAYFARLGYTVDYTGNPTVDVTDAFLHSSPQAVVATEKPVVALLAGSRRQEIRGCLPIMAEMVKHYPAFQFVVAGAPNIPLAFYRCRLPENVPVVFDKTYSLLHQSFAAVVNSGTATLETALIGTPQVVVYHVFGGRVASLLRKWLIRVPYVSLVNLVAERCLVTELITHHFTAQNLQKALQLLLYDTAYRDAMLQGYGDIRQKLGTPHAAIRTAREIYKSVSQNE